jgi:predicted nucleic acid-binding protein
MKALFDANVVLDVLLAREPHAEVAATLLSLVDQGRIEGVLCATTVTTIHYLMAKAAGRRRARKHLRDLLAIFAVAPVDRDVLVEATDLEFPDFEDTVQHEAARGSLCSCIVTRNGRDFARATLPVFSPRELLAVILSQEKP